MQKGGLLEKIERPAEQDDVAMSQAVDEFPGDLAQELVVDQQTGVTQSTGPDLDANMLGGGGAPSNTAAGETGEWVLVSNKEPAGEKSGDTTAGGDNSGTSGGLDAGGGGFDFANIDSAGDALAAYTEQNDGLDLGDLDNSAFGDAFHATDNDNVHRDEQDEMS